MSDSADRRSNHALRRRVDQLIVRAHQARAEIVERGLAAVQGRPAHQSDAAGTERPATRNEKP